MSGFDDRSVGRRLFDKHESEDLDSSGEDHAADEARYFCQLRKVPPLLPPEKNEPAWGSDPLDQFTRRMDRN